MNELNNWKTQFRKGYLELCILALIKKHEQLYGVEMLDKLRDMGLTLKERTLYPLMSRMSKDKILRTYWQTEGNKGHPRKFYLLTNKGQDILTAMKNEFQDLVKIIETINSSY